MPIKTIIFDFGNVVGCFDQRRATRALARFGRTSEEEIHRYCFNNQLEDDLEAGRITSSAYLDTIRGGCRLDAPDPILAAAYADIFTPNEDVCKLLPRLKAPYRLLLGSNTSELHSRHFREQFAETLKVFDFLVLSFEIGVRKPKASFFDHCQKHADCPADQCVFIDDMPVNVAGAQASGMHGILYRAGEDLCDKMKALGIRVDD